MFFEKNQAALRQNPQNASILAALEAVEASTEMLLAETPDGSYTLQVRGISLHAPQGAAQEAKQLASETCQASPYAKHILLGLGLGYLLAETYQQTHGPIFILEPDLPLLRFVLENADLSAYFSPRVCLSATPKALIHQLKSCYVAGDPLTTLILPGYQQLYAAWLPALQTELEHYLLYAQRERELLETSQSHWIDVFFQNIPYLHTTQAIDGLRNAFQDQPALVISPGPSLDRAMADVAALKDKMITLAAGRALRPLMEADIIPDFVVFSDYLGMGQQLHGLAHSTETCSFLLPPFTQTCCFQTPAKHKFLLQTVCDDHFSNWLDASWQHAYARIEDATNASIFAFHMARWLGCNPIILVGQDLAFHGEQLYAGGIEAQFDPQKGIAWVPGSETVSAVDYILSEIRGQDGSMMKTSTQYYVFAKELETLAQTLQESAATENQAPIRLINASTGGAFLEGFEHLSLQQLMQQEIFTPLDKTPLAQLPPDPLPPEAKQARLHQALRELVEGMEHAQAEAHSLQQVLQAMLRTPRQQWSSFQAAYQTSKEKFDQRLVSHPFLYGALFCQSLPFRNAPLPAGADPILHTIQQAEAYYTACLQTLTEQLLPWAKAAAEHFEQR